MQQEIKELQQRDDLDEIRAQLTDYPNCFGTAISYRKRNGSFDYTEPCVVAYVEEKLDEDELVVASTIPREVNGVAVDVRQRDRDAGEPLTDPDPNHSDYIAAPLRRADIRPLMAGFQNKGSNQDASAGGTLGAVLIESSSSNPHGVTAGHVATSSATVYQPYEDTNQSDDNIVGDVVYHEGFSNDDYAVYPTNDTSYTDFIAGVGTIDSVGDPGFGTRVICGGSRTGIHAGHLEAVDVTADSNLDYEVRMDTHADGSSVDKNGDSGGPCCFFDDNGDLVAFGMITQNVSTNVIGLTSLNSVMDLGFEVDTTSYSVPDPASTDYSGTSAFYEGTLIDVDSLNNTATFLVANVGGTTEQRVIETIDPDAGTTVDYQSINLGQLDFTQITLDVPSSGTQVEFTTQDMTWLVDYEAVQDQYFTDFREYTTGNFPSDWTDRWLSGYFSVQDRASSPGGKSLVYDADGASTGTDRALASWDGKTAADQEIACLITDSNDLSTYRPMVRAGGDHTEDTEEGYYGEYEAGNNSLILEKAVNNTSVTTLDSVSKSLTMPFWMRLRANGENLYLKAWEQGTEEPSSWDITATDPELTSGWLGMSVFGSNIHEMGAIGVGLSGATAPLEGNYFSGFAVTIDSTTSPVTEGETLTVDATITNEGSTQDTQDIDLSIE